MRSEVHFALHAMDDSIPSSLSNALQMPCLGRPFQLGMLYDCRDDRLIPGVTLWDHKTLQEALDSRRHEIMEYSIVAEDSIESKSSSLGIKGDLKLSCLCGLVGVLSGSAQFLDDRRSSKHQARVSLKYTTTSRFEQLTMQHLAVGKIQHPQVFDTRDATHVVTAVLYGADAFLTFDREVTGTEKYRDIHGKLKAMVKLLPNIPIGAGVGGKIDLKDTDKIEVDKFQCMFHGDFILPSNPTTFEEAVKVYKELPQLLSGDEKGPRFVPKKVWLYPLCNIESKAAKLVREISVGLVNDIQKLIENLQNFTMQANDLMKSEIFVYFQGLHEQLSRFTEMVSEYETYIAGKLSRLLPQVRGGGVEEEKLAEVVKEFHASPFNVHHLSSWLKEKEQERKLFESYLISESGLKCDGVQFVFETGDLHALVCDLGIDYVLCFGFTAAGSHSPFLDELNSYLQTGDTNQITTKQWFRQNSLINDMKTKAKIFKAFAQANRDNPGAKFAVIDISEEENTIEKGADILLYKSGVPESYEPPVITDKPEALGITHNSIEIKWSKPLYGSQNVSSYTVLYKKENNLWIEQKSGDSNSLTMKVENLNPKTCYFFKVLVHCNIGSTESTVSDPMITLESPQSRLADDLKSKSQRVRSSSVQESGLEIYHLPLVERGKIEEEGIRKYCVGDPRCLKSEIKEKVLMLVGATGAGKSTLINGIANYTLGVQWDDTFRFRLIADESHKSQAHSQTQNIASYSFPKLEGSPLPYQLTVVDTPGFGDTRGLDRDEEITGSIKAFFSIKSRAGIDHIDGIGFVAQSSLGRLTHTQKYIIDSILSVFGKDIANNIFMMTTFADGAYPPVMGAITTHIEESQPPLPLVADNLMFFKFNNSALYSEKTNTKFEKTFWELGYESFSDFFSSLGKAEPQSLTQTRAVLDERSMLQNLIQGVQEDIRRGMHSIDEMRDEKRALEDNEAKIKANKDFTYEATEHHTIKVTLDPGTYVTNCIKCNRTCHKDCKIPKDEDKNRCIAMEKGYCTVCVGHCHWEKHVNNDFRYEDKEVKVTKYFTNLETKYKNAKKGKATAESMIQNIRKKVDATIRKIYDNIRKAKECLEQLEKIALKPNPLTEVEYIDLLIKSENNERKEGWENRVKCYEKAREMAEIMLDAKKNKLPERLDLQAIVDDLLKDVPVSSKKPTIASGIATVSVGVTTVSTGVMTVSGGVASSVASGVLKLLGKLY